MIKTNTNSKKGFTIIEVVLVLAIAGLIFLMVFLALPAMQASQRDTERRNALSLFASQLTQYSANNRGKVPSTASDKNDGQGPWVDFMSKYLTKVAAADKATGKFPEDDNEFVDPDGTPYRIMYEGVVTDKDIDIGDKKFGDGDDEEQHVIHVYANAECNGEIIVKSTGARKVAFQYKLEGAGVYCGHN